MIYAKIRTGNKLLEVPADELNFFCKCPICGEETEVPLFEFMDNGDFDVYCDVYCDKCSNETGNYRKKLSEMHLDYRTMPLDKLKEFFELIAPYSKKDSEIQVDYDLMPLDKLTKIFKLIAPYTDK